LAVLLIMSPVTAQASHTAAYYDRLWTPVWAKWERELRRECPSHHVNWIGGSYYDDLISGFDRTLPAATQRNIERIKKPYDRHCAEDTEGYGCEMVNYLNAAERVGLLKQITAFSCKAFRCEDITSCTRNNKLLPKPD
jgi:hypothetical protein